MLTGIQVNEITSQVGNKILFILTDVTKESRSIYKHEKCVSPFILIVCYENQEENISQNLKIFENK